MSTLGQHRPRGSDTQTRILERAVQIASVEGLDAMSLATLAEATHMSKSGLFAHFRSKEALQIAIVDQAERMFRTAVVEPADGLQGFARLQSLVTSYVEYAGSSLFQGGCFFAAAIHEFDGRPGAVRDRLTAFLANWNRDLKAAAQDAHDRKEIIANADLDGVVFWATGVALSLNWNAQMGDREVALGHGRKAVADFLHALKHGTLR